MIFLYLSMDYTEQGRASSTIKLMAHRVLRDTKGKAEFYQFQG